MRDKAFSFLRRLHFPVMLMLTAFPPALLVTCKSPVMLSPSLMLCALCFAVAVPCILLPARFRLPGAVLCAAGLIALGVNLGSPALLCVVCAAVLLASLRLSRSTLHTIPPVFYLLGVVSHLFTQVILRSSLVAGEFFPSLAAPLSVLTMLYLILLLLTFNSISLDNAALGRHRLPASVRQINALLTVLFLALALLLASAPAIVSGVIFLWQMFKTALVYLDDLLMRLLPVQDSFGGGGMPPPMGLPMATEPINEPTFFSIVLERIASVLTGIAVIAGTAVLLYKLFFLLRQLARYLIRRLHSYVLIVSDDYVDEISDTREDGGEYTTSVEPRVRKRTPAYEKTPGGMIRARYAQLLRRHRWAGSSTARENLPPHTASLYERVRYSTHPVTREEAERFSADTRKL